MSQSLWNRRRGSAARRVLILVENLPVPFDRRVWQEAMTLRDAGYAVSVICPTGSGYESKFEVSEDIQIHRYRLPLEGSGPAGYAIEYVSALVKIFFIACRIWRRQDFDVIHACNPPDLFFLIGGFFKLFGKKFVFDHHDINPELYESKFGRRGFYYRLMLLLERLSFRTADISLATNMSYRRIAIERGGMQESRVFVVRSGPSLNRLKISPADDRLKRGRRYLIGYVGVIGEQEGLDQLLEAARHIVHDIGRKDVHFCVVGDGTALETMKSLAAALNVSAYVTFTGRVPDRLLLAVLNTADVCVNPDQANAMNDKSTMNKIMEYMALGKPIVQFDLTEGRYSAKEASLYATPRDPQDFAMKILELLDDPVRRTAMGQFGRQRVLTKLAWRHQVPALLSAYAALWSEDMVTSHETSTA